MEALKNLDMDLLITQWNRYCDRENIHEQDYYPMDELEDVLRDIDLGHIDDETPFDAESVLSDDFDKSMPYFTAVYDRCGDFVKYESVDRLYDSYIEQLYGFLTEE